MPSISSSIGMTMRVSTSSGVMPGAFMMILTCVEETSGKASIGSSRKALMPSPASSNVRTPISSRCVRANSTNRSSMVTRSQAQQLGLERGGPGNRDLRTLAECGADAVAVGALVQHDDGQRAEPRRGAQEHQRLVALPHQRLARNAPGVTGVARACR